MQKLVYQNANGEELDLTDGVKFGVTTWEGFSNCNLTVQTQTVPFADGSVYLDGLLGERELAITVAVNDNGDLGLRYQLKRELISMLNPKLGEGYLIYTNDYLSRRIKVVPYLPTFGNKNIDTAGTLKASCSFKACDPYWEDVEETEINMFNQVPSKITNVGDVDTDFKLVFNSDGDSFTLSNGTTEISIASETEGLYELNVGLGNKKLNKKNMTISEKQVVYCKTYFYSNYYKKIFGITSTNKIVVSEDEKNFTQLNITGITEGQTFQRLCVNNSGKIVIFGYINRRESNITYSTFYYNSSSDLETWTSASFYDTSEHSETGFSEATFKFLANRFLLLAVINNVSSSYDTVLFQSLDGESWSVMHTFPVRLFDIAYNSAYSRFVVCGPYYYGNILFKSSDLSTWENVSNSLTGSENCKFLEFHGNYLYITSDGGGRRIKNVFKTTNPEWSLFSGRGKPVINNDGLIIFANGVYTGNDENFAHYDFSFNELYYDSYYDFYMGFTFSQTLKLSHNLIDWEEVNGNISTIGSVYPNMIKFKNYAVMFGALGKLYYSLLSDEMSWITKSFSQNAGGYGATDGNIVVVGTYASALSTLNYTSDMITWESVQITGQIKSLIYGGGKFVIAVAVNNVLRFGCFTDPHDITWLTTTISSTLVSGQLVYHPEMEYFSNIEDGYIYTCESYIAIKPDLSSYSTITTGFSGSTTIGIFNYVNKYLYYFGSSALYKSKNLVQSVVVQAFGTSSGLIYFKKYEMYFSSIGSTLYYSYDADNWREVDYDFGTIKGILALDDELHIYSSENVYILSFADENEINSLTNTSDMTMKLHEGDNFLTIKTNNGTCFGKLTYRNRYVGV